MCAVCGAVSYEGGGLVVVRFVVLKSFLVGATMLCALLSWAVVLRLAIRTGLVRSVPLSLLRWRWLASGHLLALGFLAPRTLSWSAFSGLCVSAPRACARAVPSPRIPPRAPPSGLAAPAACFKRTPMPIPYSNESSLSHLYRSGSESHARLGEIWWDRGEGNGMHRETTTGDRTG